MPLISVMRQNVPGQSAAQHERLVRYIAERAREDADALKWTTRIGTGTAGRIVSFVSRVDGFAALASQEDPDVMIRRLYGEGDGNALVEALGEATSGTSYQVLNVREDLGTQGTLLDAPAPLAVITRLRPTPSGSRGCEELIRQVTAAAGKVDDQRRYIVMQPSIGDLGTYVIAQGVTDPAQLDRQGSVPELLAEALGASEGDKAWTEGVTCIQEATSELSVLREDLSNV
ncbi:MAG: hypothetical protein JRG92_20175 [Deltaproteobacteria bacterium]|nr:hypothetical protein [Deltaproteobacteria bacterium]MBW2696032.1 hypothetical protein [Deltaproteobacteria bacterium]